MKKSIAIAIAALGIGMAANAFANKSGPQVNPSTINLSANGTNVGIHTDEFVAGDLVSCIHVVDADPTNINFDFNPGQFTTDVDSLGHLTILIPAWDAVVRDSEGNPLIAKGEAIFYVYVNVNGGGTCDYPGEELTRATAKIVDNSGVQR